MAPPADQIADLSQSWPWPDSSIEEVMAYEIIEHIADSTHFMNELWRVLAPGAKATITTPNASKGAGFFQDPTHKSPWCMNKFSYYEEGSGERVRFGAAYGILARFKIISLHERTFQGNYEDICKITAVIEAVK